MIGEIGHPYQVQDLKMVAIDLGLGLPLVNLSPHLHAWIRWRGIVSGMERTHSPKSMGNDAMSKALRQIAKSPFTQRIMAKLPHHFT